jgi:hypothetical protein
MPQHLIERTVLALDTGDLADVWGLQEEISQLFQDRAIPELERLFDRSRDRCLDQVVVDLGTLDRRFLADQFLTKLLAALRQVLQEEESVQPVRDRAGSDREALLYFLRHGRLPWWATSAVWSQWLERWEAVLDQIHWGSTLSPTLQQRLIAQFPEAFRHRLLKQLQPTWTGWNTLLAQGRDLMRSLGLSSSAIQQLERQAWQLLLAELAPDQPSLPVARWMRQWLAQLIVAYRQTVAPDLLQQQPDFVDRQLRNVLTQQPQRSQWLTALDQIAPTPSTPLTDLEVWLYFLQQGQLPPGQPQDLAVWRSRWQALIQSQTDWRQPLQAVISTNPTAQQRLTEQFPHLTEQLAQRSIEPLPNYCDLEVLLYFLQQGHLPPGQPVQDWQTWLDRWQSVTNWQPLQTILTTNPIAYQRLIEQFPETFWQPLIDLIDPLIDPFTDSLPELLTARLTQRSQDLEVLLYFLQHGALPAGQPAQDWQSRWQSLMQSDLPWQDPVRSLLATHAIARHHLITLFPEAFRHQFVLQMQPLWVGWPQLLAEARHCQDNSLAGYEVDQPQTPNLDQHAWQILLAELVASRDAMRPLPASSWIRQWLTQWIPIAPALDRTGLSAPWHSEIDRLLPAPAPALAPDEALYVSQAGLVLLHPFISAYFDAIALLDNDAFCDKPAQQLAIHLLHYLATQQTDVPEYELVLPKILCVWPLDQPVLREMELQIAALQEAERLLQTVINYWEVLKSTSPDGLREGFLQRPGKLTRSRDGNWKLQVQHSAIDVLLGSLPWGLSMVKLPWMSELLLVEWN